MAGKHALLIGLLLAACGDHPLHVPGRVLVALTAGRIEPQHGQRVLYLANFRLRLARMSYRVRPPVKVHAHPTNLGLVYVGGEDVTSSNGYALGPGEAADFMIDDPSRLWLVGVHAGDGVSWYAGGQ